METPVLVALITASVSLILAVGKILWDWREKRSERRLEARERLDKYRAPLMAAVDDLGSCIDYIRNNDFLGYLKTDRRQTTHMTTLFRFAQYLGWTEIVYGHSDRLRFESDNATQKVNKLIRDISWALAYDGLDRSNEEDRTTTQLMLWRDEQRAIGELMRQDGGEPSCIGFDSFVENFDRHFSKWFATFSGNLLRGSSADGQPPGSERLRELQDFLAQLLKELDIDRVWVQIHSDGQLVRPPWNDKSRIEGLPQANRSSTTPWPSNPR
jgi:hypothetical protein